MFPSRRKPRPAAKRPLIKRDRAPLWRNVRAAQDPIAFVLRACAAAITTVLTPAGTRSAAVAAAEETARTSRGCATSAAAEMQSILCRAESARKRRRRRGRIKMNLHSSPSATGSSPRPCFALFICLFTAPRPRARGFPRLARRASRRWLYLLLGIYPVASIKNYLKNLF